MLFENYLRNINKDDMLMEVEYFTPPFLHLNTVLSRLVKAVTLKEKILLVSDPDVDGFCSLLCFRDMFRTLGVKVDIQEFNSRSHKINKKAIERILVNNYDLVIITDTGSSENEVLNNISMYSDILLIDHHYTENEYKDYNERVYCLNSIIENRSFIEEVYSYSAGALSFIVANKVLNLFNIKYNNLSAYALTSLYSDCMDMTNYLNRAIYFKAIDLDYIPNPISQFCSDYTIFSRRFLVYRYINKINSLFRAERFDLINSIIFKDKLTEEQMIEIDKELDNSRQLVNFIVDTCNIETIGEFSYMDITDTNIDLLTFNVKNIANYTGLIANKISAITNKPCVVLCENKGSFRDLYCRDFLTKFKEFSDSNGHPSAFGINIENLDYFIENLYSNHFKTIKPKNEIIFKIDSVSFDDVKDMAFYNEFTSCNSSQALLEVNAKKLSSVKDKFYNSYKYGEYKIKSTRNLRNLDKILVRPEISNSLYLYYVS